MDGVVGWERALVGSLEGAGGSASGQMGFCLRDAGAAGAIIGPGAVGGRCCDAVTEQQPLGDVASDLQCFKGNGGVGRSCVRLQQALRDARRCEADADCGGVAGVACMRPYIPHPSIRIVRIRVVEGRYGGGRREGRRAGERTVLYLGDPREVWEAAPTLDGHMALVAVADLVLVLWFRSDPSAASPASGGVTTSAALAKARRLKDHCVLWIGRISAGLLGSLMAVGVVGALSTAKG
ncbi:hypothetical protein HK101_005541 [Irineochytrium annulatum]|nr:hypothetical protein HK101_005541 [Irineochytrium annulatum]